MYVNSDTETAGTKHTAALADGFEYQHSSTAVLRHKVLHSNAMFVRTTVCFSFSCTGAGYLLVQVVTYLIRLILYPKTKKCRQLPFRTTRTAVLKYLHHGDSSVCGALNG